MRDREEVPETNEVSEKDEALEKEAINGKEKVLEKQEANKEEEVSGQEKETMQTHGLAYKGVRHAQRHPLKKEFELSRLQGKHLEQEQESQGARPRGKNQVRWTRATGQPPKKEFELSRVLGKNLEQEQESKGTIPRRKNQARKTGATGQGESGSKHNQAGFLHTRAQRQPPLKDLKPPPPPPPPRIIPPYKPTIIPATTHTQACQHAATHVR